MKKLFAVLFIAFILIQFFPVEQDNPITDPDMDFLRIKKTSESMSAIIRNSCYDCHSNETNYPWYTRLQPVGWFMKNHIDEGRKHLNFSVFATYELKQQAHKLKEAAEMVGYHEMPLDSYLLVHPQSSLSTQQRAQLVKYLLTLEKDLRLKHNLLPEKIN